MKLNAIQFLVNSSFMMTIIFIPLFAKSLGASYFEIGIIGAAFGFMTSISSYIFGRVADIHKLKSILLVGLLASAITFFLQIFATCPISLAIVRGFAGFSIGIAPGALIAFVHYKKKSIGKFSSFGALGWTIGYILAGLIGNIYYLFVISSLFFCIAFICALGLEDIEKPVLDLGYFSHDTLIKNIRIYLAIFVRHAGAVSVWTILPLYLAYLGANMFWIGMIYAINPAVQFFIMRNMGGFKNETLVSIGYILSIFAFVSFAFAPTYLFIIPGMILVACSWSFLFVGSMNLVIKKNLDIATSAGLLNFSISAASVTGPLIGGTLLQFYGFEVVLFGAAILSFFGFVIFVKF